MTEKEMTMIVSFSMVSKYLFFFLLLLVLPTPLFAAGLLPECSINTNSVLTSPCNACDLILLIQNLLRFTYTYLIPFFSALFLAWGGILMLSAGMTGNTGQYDSGERVLGTTIKGVVILLLAWLIIDTILKVVGARIAIGANDPWRFGPWNKVECHIAPPPGGPRVVIIPSEIHINPPPDLQCGSGESYKLVDGQNICDPAVQAQIRGIYQSGIEGGSFRSYNGSGICTKGVLGAYQSDLQAASQKNGISLARLQATIMVESSGNPHSAGSQGEIGLMQVLPGVACDLRKSSVPGCATDAKGAGVVANQAAVQEWLRNPQNNISVGSEHYKTFFQRYGNYDLATAAYNGGAMANKPSVNCPGSLRWQCGWDNNDHTRPNTGYDPTRKYVPYVAASEKAILSGSCVP